MHLQLSVESKFSADDALGGEMGTLATSLVKESTSAFNEGSTRTYRVLTGVSNQTVDLAGLAEVRYIAIKCDVQVTLRINGSESVTIRPPTGFDFGWLVLSTSGVTALDVSNASGDTATLSIQLAGDIT